jgi:Flp pilus assembly protein TadD
MPGMAVDADWSKRAEVARQALVQGRMPDAAELYAELARMFPWVDSLHSNLGVTLRQVGRVEAAVASLRRASALAPENAGGSAAILL